MLIEETGARLKCLKCGTYHKMGSATECPECGSHLYECWNHYQPIVKKGAEADAAAVLQ